MAASMLVHLKRLFAYDAWANQEVLDNLKSISGTSPPKALKLHGHILGVEALWLERLQQRKTGLVWPDLTLEQCQKQADVLIADWRFFLSEMKESGLDSGISYTNSKGEKFTSTVEDILHHVAVHSVYHRGQIAAEVRAAGYTPAYTDFIHAVRSKGI